MKVGDWLVISLIVCQGLTSCSKCEDKTRYCPSGFTYNDYFYNQPSDTLRFQSSLGTIEMPFVEAVQDEAVEHTWCSPKEKGKTCVTEGYHYYRDSIAGIRLGVSYFGRFTNYATERYYVGVRIISDLGTVSTSFVFDPFLFTSAPNYVHMYFYDELEVNGQLYQQVVKSVFTGQSLNGISECSLSRSHGLVSFTMFLEGEWREFVRIE